MANKHRQEPKPKQNRLNVNEKRIWDRCFIYFVRTGEWIMGMSDGEHKSGRNLGCDCNGEYACDDCPGYGNSVGEIIDQELIAADENKLVDGMAKVAADLIIMDKNATPFVEPLGTFNMRKPGTEAQVRGEDQS